MSGTTDAAAYTATGKSPHQIETDIVETRLRLATLFTQLEQGFAPRRLISAILRRNRFATIAAVAFGLRFVWSLARRATRIAGGLVAVRDIAHAPASRLLVERLGERWRRARPAIEPEIATRPVPDLRQAARAGRSLLRNPRTRQVAVGAAGIVAVAGLAYIAWRLARQPEAEATAHAEAAPPRTRPARLKMTPGNRRLTHPLPARLRQEARARP